MLECVYLYKQELKMAIKKGQELDLTITDLAFGGKGISKVDGLVVFVGKAVPGDHVRARIVKKKKQHAEARIIELLTPSPMRITPPCRYSGYCGGCTWQFLDYDKQLHYKRQHVHESLAHIAKLEDVTVNPVMASARQFGYRNKMEFSCSDRRWLLPEELSQPDIKKGLALGLHVPGTFNKVLDIERCHLHPSLGNDILGEVRRYIKESRQPVYGLKSHVGYWRFLMLRHSPSADEWMVNIITATENREEVMPLAEQLTDKYPNIVSVVNNITARKAGVAFGEYEVPLIGASILRDKIGKFEFEISANSFFQTNTAGAECLYNTVKDYAELSGGETVLDLYCGTGTIGIFLSENAKEVIGIELVESAVADAEKNSRLNGISNCRFILGDIKDSLSTVGVIPDVMIIDPPRVGMHKDVVKQVLAMGPPKIVYVSCNPSTLARDVALLKEDYDILDVQPVDMFPHTYHIETVAKLIKKT